MPVLLDGRDARENPNVQALLSAPRDSVDYEAALAISTGQERLAAVRLIRLELGAEQAASDQRLARLADLERRYPGIEHADD